MMPAPDARSDDAGFAAAARRYDALGFCIGPKLFSDEEVGKIRRAIERALAGERDFDCMHSTRTAPFDAGSKDMYQLINGWWVNRAIRQAVFSPRLGFWAARLLKTAELRVVHDQVLYKPPLTRCGDVVSDGNIGWHQDAPHLDVFDTTTFITAWIALQDCSLDNGTVQFIAGSHRWGYRPDANTFREKDLDGLRQRFADEGRQWRPVPAIMRAGQVSFHSGLIFHGSGANRGDEPRMSIAVNMMPGDTRYNKHGRYHFLGSLMGPLVKHGDRCGDPLFPRNWPANRAMTEGEYELDGMADWASAET